jgi:hypothetical protein
MKYIFIVLSTIWYYPLDQIYLKQWHGINEDKAKLICSEGFKDFRFL